MSLIDDQNAGKAIGRWSSGWMSIFLCLVSTVLSTVAVVASGWIPVDAGAPLRASMLFVLFCIVLGPIILLHLSALVFAGAALIKGDGRLLAMLGLIPNGLFLSPLFAYAHLTEQLGALPTLAT